MDFPGVFVAPDPKPSLRCLLIFPLAGNFCVGVRLGCLKRTPDVAAAGLMELRHVPCGPRVSRALGGMYHWGKLPPRVLPANTLFSGIELYLLGGQLYERELSKFASKMGVLVVASLGAMPGLGCRTSITV